MWDAAYVLGSLDSEERRQYEAHLSTCERCREAVAELSGMPGLLALLDPDEVAALEEGSPELPALPPVLLDSLLAKVGSAKPAQAAVVVDDGGRGRRGRRGCRGAGRDPSRLLGAVRGAACDITIGADHDPGGAKLDRRDGQPDQSGVGYPHRDDLHLPEGVGELRPARQ